METCQLWVETGVEKNLARGVAQTVAPTVAQLEDERWGILQWKHVDGHMEWIWSMKIFVLHVHAHQKVSTLGKASKKQLAKITWLINVSQPSSLVIPELTRGHMNEMTVVSKMASMYGPHGMNTNLQRPI